MQTGTNGFVVLALVTCACALALTCFPQDATAQYGAPYLVAVPQESGHAYVESGQALVHAPGQQLQPYGFLWSGYNATVEYDIYGLRRAQQPPSGPFGGMFGAAHCLGDENNPCGDPDCSTCKSRPRGLFHGVNNPFARSSTCHQRCPSGCNGECCNGECRNGHGSNCRQQSPTGSASTEQDAAAPQPVNDTAGVSPAVPVPTPVNDPSDWPQPRRLPENELPQVEPRRPDRPTTDRIQTTTAPDPAPDQIDPMPDLPDPPEPTLHVPTHTDPRLPRNRLPQTNSSGIDSSNIDSPDEESRSSRRPQRARTLAAVGQYIKS